MSDAVLLRGGRVVDPAAGCDEPADVLVAEVDGEDAVEIGDTA